MRQPLGRPDLTSLSSERDVTNSNVTLNAFIGGSRNARQKSWMANQPPAYPTPRQASPSTRQTRDVFMNQPAPMPSPVPSDDFNSMSTMPEAGGVVTPRQLETPPFAGAGLGIGGSGAIPQFQPEERRVETRAGGNANINMVPLVDLLQSPSPEPAANSTQVPARPTNEGERHRVLPGSSMVGTALSSDILIAQTRQRSMAPLPMIKLKPHIASIDKYLESVGGEAGLQSNLERARFRLLRNACEAEDVFYIAIHQLFCAWDTELGRAVCLDPGFPVSLPPFHILGIAFGHLGNLLRPNSLIAPAPKKWLSDFPAPLLDLLQHSESYRTVVQAVADSLILLSNDFTRLGNDCFARNYPPLVDEMITRLGITSPILQGIIFTATRRNFGIDDDAVGQAMEAIFRDDQRDYQNLIARLNTDRPPIPDEFLQRKGRLAKAYRRLIGQNLQRGRPSGPQNQAFAVPSPHTPDTPPPPPLNANGSQANQHPSYNWPQPPVLSSVASSTSAGASPDISAAARAISLNSPGVGTTPSFRRPSRSASSNIPRVAHAANLSPHSQQHPNLPSNAPLLRSNTEPTLASAAPDSIQGFASGGTSLPPDLAALIRQQQDVISNLQLLDQSLHELIRQSQSLPIGQIPGIMLQQQQTLIETRANLRQTKSLLDQRIAAHPQYDARNVQEHGQVRIVDTVPVQQGLESQRQGASSIPSQSPQVQSETFHPAVAEPTSSRHNLERTSVSGHVAHEPIRNSSSGGLVVDQAHYHVSGQNSSHPPAPPINHAQANRAPVPIPRLPPPPVLVPLVPPPPPISPLDQRIIPPFGYVHPPFGPHPEIVAIHQAHLRSPNFVPREIFPSTMDANDPARRFYQVITGFAYPPFKLTASQPVTLVEFSITPAEFSLLARSKHPEPGCPENREFARGTLQYRMRCVKMRPPTQDTCHEGEWVVSDTTWPDSVVFQVYIDVRPQQIELKRKNHHGKDVPVDLTPYVRCVPPGQNIRVTISIPGPRTCLKEASYFFAIETIEIFAHTQLLNKVQKHRRPERITLDALKKSLAGPELNDDDIALVSSEVTIDITDPFSSQLFEIPVRGNDCLHRECFDLKTFLLSRTTKPNKLHQPTLIDVWKCPLCNRDARPANLHVDEFMANVRKVLIEQDAARVKAILINKDGMWKVKQPLAGTITNGKRKSNNDESDSEDERAEERKRRAKSASDKPAPVIIDLSD